MDEFLEVRCKCQGLVTRIGEKMTLPDQEAKRKLTLQQRGYHVKYTTKCDSTEPLITNPCDIDGCCMRSFFQQEIIGRYEINQGKTTL